MQNTIKLSSGATHEFWELAVLFEDPDLLALNKPAGLLTAPDPEQPDRPSLLRLLHAGIAERKHWAKVRNLDYLVNAHRLDPESSGVLLLVRNKGVQAKLANLFGSEKSLTRYLVLVQGQPPEPQFDVDAKIGPHPGRPGSIRVDPRRGKRARTHFTVLERFAGWTLLQADPLTSRPHQIRVHLRSAGLPVAGDHLYGGKPLLLSRLKDDYHLKPNQEERPLIALPAVHAEQLTLPHPVTGAELIIRAPWPKDLLVAVKYLRRYASI